MSVFVNLFIFNEIRKANILIEGVIVELSITFWFELTLQNTLEGVTLKALVEGLSSVVFKSLDNRAQFNLVGNSPPACHRVSSCLSLYLLHLVQCLVHSSRRICWWMDEWTPNMTRTVPGIEVLCRLIITVLFNFTWKCYFPISLVVAIYILLGCKVWVRTIFPNYSRAAAQHLSLLLR